MTIRYVGEIQYADGKVIMPTETKLPPKQQWASYAIYVFNGKRYNTVTQKAEDNLNATIKKIEAEGKTKAVKDGKIKPSSIRYGILTTGVEPFTFV